MAPPRAKASPDGLRLSKARVGDTEVPVYRDEQNHVVMQSICQPSGVTSRVRPRMGASLPKSTSDVMQRTAIEGRTVQRTVPLDDHP